MRAGTWASSVQGSAWPAEVGCGAGSRQEGQPQSQREHWWAGALGNWDPTPTLPPTQQLGVVSTLHFSGPQRQLSGWS